MELEYQWLKKLWWTVGLIVISSVVILVEKVILRPRRIRKMLEKQGIKGPKPSFPFGNVTEMQKIRPQRPESADITEDWVYSLFPYFHTWKQQYGSLFTYSTGIKQHLYVEDGKVIKDLSVHMSPDLGRVEYLNKALLPMLGDGILRANGKSWIFQRNLIIAELFMSKVKTMVGYMEGSALEIVQKWERLINESKDKVVEIVIENDLKVLSEDIISKACFGSDYQQGKYIFERLAGIQNKLSKTSTLLGFLNLSFLPSKESKEVWKLKKEVDVLIMNIIHAREKQNQENNNGEKQNDLLQKIIEGVAKEKLLNASGKGTLKPGHDMNQLIIDICKSIYFAGSESTAISVVWALYLLSVYPEWQQRIRDEISEIFGDDVPPSFTDMSKLQKMKTLTMVVLESMRIYGPAVTNSRETFADLKIGDLVLPKGLYLWMFVPLLHRDVDNWGPDATEFKPERFANGLSGACKYPQAYMPFGYGSRFCLGQNFTLTEIKIVIALMVYNFDLKLSPNYVHCPGSNFLLVPKYGMKLHVSKRNTGK
ncbi:cytochrome P450 714A2-like [Vicia villosa]|uniref:cytochrome P450 714A2-like n=1 Tax=Vicia villosa TaxID=3911 RepID=UPI00273C3C15|nr:cytochrome P450 714A2-like [Vicia villosa]